MTVGGAQRSHVADQTVSSPSAMREGGGGAAVCTSTSIRWLFIIVPVLKRMLKDALGSFTFFSLSQEQLRK